MKKFFKFLLGTISLATLACGAYYFIKKYVCKESEDDFEDFEDDYDDYETEDVPSHKADGREYVSINITSEDNDTPEAAEESPAEQENQQEEPAAEKSAE